MVILLCAVRVKSNVWNGKENGPTAIGKADGVSGRRLTLRPFSKRIADRARTRRHMGTDVFC